MVINCSAVTIIVLYMCLHTTCKVHEKKEKLYSEITTVSRKRHYAIQNVQFFSGHNSKITPGSAPCKVCDERQAEGCTSGVSVTVTAFLTVWIQRMQKGISEPFFCLPTQKYKDRRLYRNQLQIGLPKRRAGLLKHLPPLPQLFSRWYVS